MKEIEKEEKIERNEDAGKNWVGIKSTIANNRIKLMPKPMA